MVRKGEAMTTIRWAAVLLSVSLGAGAVQAQEELKVQVSYDLQKPAVPLQRILLRPNTTQAVYFFVTNPDLVPKKNVTFKLVQLDAEQPTVLHQTNIPSIGGQKTVRVDFGKAPEVK